MATILNHPVPTHAEGPGVGFLAGIILIVLLAVLFFLYTMPAPVLNSGIGQFPTKVVTHTYK